MDRSRLVPGLAAVALFVVLALSFLTAGFGTPQGFGPGSVTASIGFAMFDLVDQAAIESEPMLLAFETIDIVLVAALVAAVMLARREGDASTPLGTTDEADETSEAGARAAATDGGEVRE